jgi:hypothetical protein
MTADLDIIVSRSSPAAGVIIIKNAFWEAPQKF